MSKTDYEALRNLSVLNNPIALALVKQFNLKKVVEGRGHDCGGLICDLYLKSTKILAYHDDGWGGQPEITFLDDAKEQRVIKMLSDINFAQIMFDNGWAFMDSPTEICKDTQVEHVISLLQELKHFAKIQKKCISRFVYGTKSYQQEIYWTGVKNLNQISVKQLQKTYDKYKKELKDGEKFFNTDKQLKSLGIKA